MKSKSVLIASLLLVFLLGAAVPAIVVWNPGHWGWADTALARVRPQAGMEAGAPQQLWTCGMHPQVIEDHPGNCPICGMKLVPLGSQSATLAAADSAPEVSGTRVDPSFLQNFAVRTTKVSTGSIPLDIRTVGILGYNEKDIAQVTTKFEGWIEKVRVNYVGEPVTKGQVLFEIYSPQLVTTEQEYLATLDYIDKLEQGANQDALSRARALLDASRERLRYWDMTDPQIDTLRRDRRITRTLDVYAPVSGVVVSKMDAALEGMKLTPGMTVYRIANMGTVWAKVEVYEDQVRFLSLGQTADITLDAFPGRHWSGKIIYLDPAMNQQSRTLKASVEIANPDSTLRPDMYANVMIRVPAAGGAVKVPSEAILHTGERSIVIVEAAPGVFQPREVTLGAGGGGFQEVRSGLEAGETIVTSSQFLIDSESNLKEAISKMLAGRK